MGGVRVFCLDCSSKDDNTFDTLDLCCSPEARCIDERVTYREDLKAPHEPNHRLVKIRIAMFIHHYGRTYKLACAAFERVENICAKIAGVPRTQQEEQETGQGARNASTEEPTTTKVPSKNDEPDDVAVAADGTKCGAEEEPTITVMPSESDNVPTAVDGTGDGAEAEQTVTETPNSDKPDDVPAAVDVTKNEAETEDKGDEVSQCTARVQRKDGDLPTCGKCNGSLSFPFWYCIFCEGQS